MKKMLIIKPMELLEKLYSDHISGSQGLGNLREHERETALLVQEKLEYWKPFREKGAFDDAPFQVVDFFCGCGGMSLGFAAISSLSPFFKLIGGCDIDSDATKSYQRNFNVPALAIDVRLLDSDKTALVDFLEDIDGYDNAKPLIAIGCAPCQGFTSHKKRSWDIEDKRNTLVGTFASIATKLDSECVIMENVPELLSNRYWNHFEEARTILQNAGYVVHQAIYNAASFRVPQERFRAIVVAMKRDFLLPKPLVIPEEYVTVRQAIGHLPKVMPGQMRPEDKLHRSARHRKSTIETIRAVPHDGGSRPVGIGPKCLDRVSGFYDVYGRLYWDKPAITITHYARNPASGRFVHPEQDRGLTMRETALLQSFPMGFEFVGSFDSIFKQIGEAVPPRLACGVATSVLFELLSPPPTKQEKENGISSITEPVSDSFSSVIAGLKRSRRSA